jgi:hypothetical protein
VLDRFERRLDRLVSGAFAKAFRAEVQPVEIASALQRECDDKAVIVTRGRTIVPNEFRVELGPHDFDRLEAYQAALAAELGGLVQEHSKEQGYALVGPVSVRLLRDDDLDTGVFRVLSEAVPGELPPAAQSVAARLEVEGRVVRLTAGDEVVIGRGGDAQVQLTDAGVSRRHAVLRLTEIPTITDLGSTNGTTVDGVRVAQAELRDGAQLTFGATRAVFRYGG